MKALVVINPSSRDFEAEKKWPALQSILTQLAEISVIRTDPDDEKTKVALEAELDREPQRVIAIGGDGTIHLVVNALLSNKKGRRIPELATIPFGTANDVAKSLSLPVDDPARLAEIAVGSKLGKLDIGHVLARAQGKELASLLFLDAVTIGMDADVLAARGNYRNLGGYLAYAAALAERAIEQQSLDVHIDVDKAGLDTRVFNVIINNVRIYAGELEMPGARNDDGMLDVYLFNRREYASKLVSIAVKQVDVLGLGVHELLEDITDNQRSYHGRHIALRLASPRRLQADGELLGEADEVICEVAGSLSIAVP